MLIAERTALRRQDRGLGAERADSCGCQGVGDERPGGEEGGPASGHDFQPCAFHAVGE